MHILINHKSFTTNLHMPARPIENGLVLKVFAISIITSHAYTEVSLKHFMVHIQQNVYEHFQDIQSRESRIIYLYNHSVNTF